MARPAFWAAWLVLIGCSGAVEPPQVPDAAPPPPGHPVELPADEVLRRLSQLLFDAPPDAQQQAAAARLDLSTTGAVAALARTMLGDPRAARGIDRFVQHWLALDDLPALPKDPQARPAWSPALAEDMLAEVRRFVAHVILEGDGRLETLLTAPLAFPNERLAPLYGFPGVSGPELRLVTHDGRQRLGILGLPGVIAERSREARTYPSHRGNFVAFRFACRPVSMLNQVDPIVPDRTMRDLQDSATSYAGCQTCHHLMNPPGWAFEHFDALGAWRTSDLGLPVDASGRLPADLLDSGAAVPFDGLPDLARALAASPRAPLCHAMFWLTFAAPSTAPMGPFGAAASINARDPPDGFDEVLAAFEASGHDIKALIAAVASSHPFLRP
jgi:hypothetical protein